MCVFFPTHLTPLVLTTLLSEARAEAAIQMAGRWAPPNFSGAAAVVASMTLTRGVGRWRRALGRALGARVLAVAVAEQVDGSTLRAQPTYKPCNEQDMLRGTWRLHGLLQLKRTPSKS
jgi:hypothetical protein